MARIALACLIAAAIGVGTAGAGARPATRTITAQLSPKQVVRPESQEPNARGSVTVELNARTGQVCYTIGLMNIAPVTRFFVARAAKGARATDLPIFIVPFDVTSVPNGTGIVRYRNKDKAYSGAYSHWIGVFSGAGCISLDRSTVSQVIADPGAYYLDVRTTTSDTGALRGQL
jgi:hypothetical protein